VRRPGAPSGSTSTTPASTGNRRRARRARCATRAGPPLRHHGGPERHAVYEPFFETLQGYCRHNKAQLLVIPYRYKNPTSRWSQKAKATIGGRGAAKHLIDRRVKLNDNLLLLADIKTQPTASNPLEGFETISAAVGHHRAPEDRAGSRSRRRTRSCRRC
jgi:hypothetical protein